MRQGRIITLCEPRREDRACEEDCRSLSVGCQAVGLVWPDNLHSVLLGVVENLAAIFAENFDFTVAIKQHPPASTVHGALANIPTIVQGSEEFVFGGEILCGHALASSDGRLETAGHCRTLFLTQQAGF